MLTLDLICVALSMLSLWLSVEGLTREAYRDGYLQAQIDALEETEGAD